MVCSIKFEDILDLELVGGLEHFLFSHNIGLLIIPLDELIFFRGVAPAHQPVEEFCTCDITILVEQLHAKVVGLSSGSLV